MYINRGVYRGFPAPEYRFDVTTGHLSATTRRAYTEDVRSHPRGLVAGDTWQTGTPTDGVGQDFRVIGSRLVPVLHLESDWSLAKAAFDTATHRALRLRLPAGYRAGTSDFRLFEWLDDDTVALTSSRDILTCRVSSGRCVVAAQASKDGKDGRFGIVVPNFPLPG